MSNIDTINAAVTAIEQADGAYAAAKKEFDDATAAYYTVKGIDVKQATIGDLLKKYGPLLAKYGATAGFPAGLVAAASDPGAFGTISGLLGKLVGL